MQYPVVGNRKSGSVKLRLTYPVCEKRQLPDATVLCQTAMGGRNRETGKRVEAEVTCPSTSTDKRAWATVCDTVASAMAEQPPRKQLQCGQPSGELALLPESIEGDSEWPAQPPAVAA